MDKMKNITIRQQLQRNAVALISLTVAISSFAYNSWRNEQSEQNRNQRFASFEILLKLNELQQLVFHRIYDPLLVDKGNPRMGWAHIITITDLSQVLPPPLPDKAQELLNVWNDNWSNLAIDNDSSRAILAEIDHLRSVNVALLKTLK
ncbi:MAG: hypothetical protein ACJAXJ_004546 [Colwellia sp.]|jgi:hypothetical protein|tara:strand:- start:60 stop:503 length:444 start_codon:yes stop_codon:yes gene_type:complete